MVLFKAMVDTEVRSVVTRVILVFRDFSGLPEDNVANLILELPRQDARPHFLELVSTHIAEEGRVNLSSSKSYILKTCALFPYTFY